MEIKYWFEMPNKWTFYQPKLLSFISKYIPHNATVLIPFAGKFRFGKIDNSKFIYNDINPEIKANHHIDAYKLVWLYPKEYFDCIIADPPYTFTKAIHYYGNKKHTDITMWRDSAYWLLKPNGIYIELGYNSTGLRKDRKHANEKLYLRGIRKIALGICCIGTNKNDILIIVQQKYNNLSEFID